jgi:hypothetical protein
LILNKNSAQKKIKLTAVGFLLAHLHHVVFLLLSVELDLQDSLFHRVAAGGSQECNSACCTRKTLVHVKLKQINEAMNNSNYLTIYSIRNKNTQKKLQCDTNKYGELKDIFLTEHFSKFGILKEKIAVDEFH